MAAHFVAVIDTNLIGVGSLAGALVIAIGYMLHDRRDTDRRVDAAQAEVNATLRAQLAQAQAELDRERDECRFEREQLEQDKRRYRELVESMRAELDELRDRVRTLQSRLSLFDEGIEP